MTPKTVGFIGLGNMGSGMAGQVLKEAGSLLVWDLSEKRLGELREAGASAAESQDQLAKDCDLIFLSLPGPAQVREVVAGEKGLLRHAKAGRFLIDLSTVDPATSRRMAEEAGEKGVTYVDIPVSGGVANAATGGLTMMAGGTEEELGAVMPYLRAIGKTHYFTGRRGGGSAIKIINNFMAFCIQFINAEALLMADHLEIPFDTFFHVVSNSTGGNTILRQKEGKIRTGDIEPGFSIELTIKDLELAVQLCRDCGISNFTLGLVVQFYRMAEQRGYGRKDSSSIIKLLRELEPKRP